MIKKYYKHLKELSQIGSAMSVLYQDMETHMPHKANEERGDQIALLAQIYHKRVTSRKFGKIVYALFEQLNDLKKEDQRSVILAKKQYDKACKVPSKFIKDFERAKSISQSTWNKAKQNNDFKTFLPHLKKMFDMSRQYAKYINPDEDPYNVLLDEYEEGYTIKDLLKTFGEIKEQLKKIIESNRHKDLPKVSYTPEDFPKHKVQEFFRELVSKIGFDLERGNIGEVGHPYETSISPNDIRINTNYSDFIGSLTGIIHELGHGLYEQNIHEDFYLSNLCGGVSLGFHESQSRLLENIIGRSKPFIKFLLPLLKKHFPQIQRDVDELYNTITNVKPSLIRIHADEVTYNMHIIIRFEIEQALLSGELKYKDLPTMRNEKMEEYLGVKPTNYTEGCMQDVHWSEGLIGYFPTYTIGNLLSAQLRKTFTKDHPNRGKEIERGDFSSYFKRFKQHIRQYGALHEPKILTKQITGEEINAKYFLDYITAKYAS